jgi:hypothetical protein
MTLMNQQAGIWRARRTIFHEPVRSFDTEPTASERSRISKDRAAMRRVGYFARMR